MAFKKFFKENGMGYLFLTPWIIGVLLFHTIPILFSLYLSFTEYDLFTSPEWIGISNYTDMFTKDIRFTKSLEVTFMYVLLGVFLELSFALLLAVILNKGISGLKLYRAFYYVPSLFGASVAIALLWRQVFGHAGFVNNFLNIFGIEGANWISNPSYALYTLIILRVWQFGSPMIIFLAGLKQIPTELYESAMVDGAGKFRQFIKITIPLLTPIIFFNLVMQMINAFQAFTQAYIVSNGSGGPLDSTLFYTLYLYQQGFQSFSMGYASAMAWFLLLIISFFTALAFWSSKKWVYYEH